jgi:DNA-directed RNA polymerase sigma subunit (sigma70/sigma32)
MNEKEKNDNEKHLIRMIDNLNDHLHSVKLLLSHVSKPLLVDDRGLRTVLSSIHERMKETFYFIERLDVVQTLGEIKFIGKRLNEIEKLISEIKSSGVEKTISLDVRLDGYETVKKTVKKIKKDEEIVETKQLQDEYEDEDEEKIKKVLKTLKDREYEVLVHRFGLFGERKKTLKQTALLFNLKCGGSIRRIEMKAIRKLAHPSRYKYIEDITHVELKKSINSWKESYGHMFNI